jgi:hypothetical protein
MRPPFIVVIAAILAIVILAVTFRERVLFAFAPDGINLLKNGSFEGGNPENTNDLEANACWRSAVVVVLVRVQWHHVVA